MPDNLLTQAVSVLRAGGLVAFPTETVYGLGADATNSTAVQKIFAAKGRPTFNPLICHVVDQAMARRYAAIWPVDAEKLADAFWPGPLTIVVRKTNEIVPEVTANLDSVGLRAPDHPFTLDLIRAFDRPLAGPSANRSNHISPTTADHVRADLGDRVDLILDGGPCAVGIESTVLDLTTSTPTILRPGKISAKQIESAINTKVMTLTLAPRPFESPRLSRESSIAEPSLKSPGQLPVHYAPKTPALRYVDPRQIVDADAGVLALSDFPFHSHRGPTIQMPRDAIAYAHNLYANLRELDAMNLPAIYIELPPDDPGWSAVRDRLCRATRPI